MKQDWKQAVPSLGDASHPSAAPPQTIGWGRRWLAWLGACWRTLRPLVGLGLASLGQAQLFATPDDPWRALGLWLVALACWFPLTTIPWVGVDAPPVTQTRPINWQWVGVSIGLGAVAFWAAGTHRYTPLVVLPWLLSIGLAALALSGWRPGVTGWGWRWRTWVAELRWEGWRSQSLWLALAVGLLLALGTGLRFYQLDAVPREMTSDHVEKLLDVNDLLNGERPLFFIRNTGREPFQFYYTFALMQLFDLPLSHLALKVGTALAGSVTLIFIFLLAHELAGREVALWTLLLSAISRWPIALSRAGLRYPFAPLFAAPALYFLVRGLKYRQRADFVWAGLCIGVGLHGYISFRIIPLTVVCLVLLWLWRYRQSAAERWGLLGHLTIVGFMAFVVFGPLFRYMLDEPQMFWYRVLTRVGETEVEISENPLLLLVINLLRVGLMFNYTGDMVWTVNISRAPTFSVSLAALFGLGFVYLLVRSMRGDRWAVFVLVSFFCLLLPSGLSIAFPRENPSLARTGISIPLVFLITAWPLALIRREVGRQWPGGGGRLLAGSVLAVLLVMTLRTNFHDYFVVFRDQYAYWSTNPSEVAAVIQPYLADGVPPEGVWLKGYPYWLDARAVSLETFGSFAWENAVLEPDELVKIGDTPGPKLIVLHISDRVGLQMVQQLYPWGELQYHAAKVPGKGFFTYFVTLEVVAPGGSPSQPQTLREQ